MGSKIQGMGFQGNFYWWEGVVEDNLDPLGIGRCRVRIIGHHSGDKAFLPTDELPWAYPVLPVNNQPGKIVAMKSGTRVFGFSRDGESCQDLVIIGTMNTGFENPPVVGDKPGGFNEEDPTLYGHRTSTIVADNPERFGLFGFVDDRKRSDDVDSPLGSHNANDVVVGQPKKTQVTISPDSKTSSFKEVSDYHPLSSGTNEVNVPRLARGEWKGTITHAHMDSNAEIKVPSTGKTVIEPDSPYDAMYPFNSVEESDSGHVKEVDDTPGSERLKETHRTGTFYEIHPDGTKVTKVVKDDFSVTIGDKGVKVQGVCAVHVVGQADFYCESDIYVNTEKNATVTTENDMYAVVKHDMNASVLRDTLVTAGSNIDIIAGGDMSIQAGGEILFKDVSATASNVDEIIKDTVDGKGNARIRVDDPS